MKKINIIPIFVPHLGCPNDCVFCNQNRITNTNEVVNKDIARNIIETYIGYFKDKSNVEIAFYGGSFTAIEKSLQDELLSIAKEYKDKKSVKYIRVSTRPDCIDESTLNRLQYYKVDNIELGVQSLDDEVLKKSNRGHNSSCVYEAVNLIKKSNFKLGLQQMIGLPGDNLKSSVYTAMEFIKLEPDFVRIYPTLVIKDTQLEDDFKLGKYNPLSLDESVKITKEILKMYMVNDIEVIRVGLQATENIQIGNDVIAGPFHPAFRQFVESEIMLEVITNYLLDTNIDILTISANGRNISNIAGQKGINKQKIINKLKLKSLNLSIIDLEDNYLILEYNNFKDKISLKNELMEKLCI